MSRGAFCLSLDCELAWGSRDKRDPATYADSLAKTRDVIANMLNVFVKHRISATWAVVGHLMLDGATAVAGKMHPEMPRPNSALHEGDWYAGVPEGDLASEPYYYAPDVVEKITSCPVSQELACHTFSHVIVGAPGCSAEVARAEFHRCKELAARRGRETVSVVFPRNCPGHLDLLVDLGYRCFRGQNSEWYCHLTRPASYGMGPVGKLLALGFGHIRPLFRLIDERMAITPPLPPVRRTHRLWEIPQSMFFSGFIGPTRYVSAKDRTRKAIKGLIAAAERKRIFSLWTHPHNLADRFEELFPAFERICEVAAEKRDRGELQILTMRQIADLLDHGKRPEWL